MPGPKAKLHLPFAAWPEIDRRMWKAATEDGDILDDGPCARLAKRTLYRTGGLTLTFTFRV